MSKEKKCESCGMPMRKAKDFGGRDTSNKYCGHCTTESGKLKSYEEVLDGLTNFIVQMQGLERRQAEKAARDGLSKMPTWKNT